MLWQNNKCDVILIGGCARLKLPKMFGLIQQFIVIPENNDTIWSLRLLDSENDVIYEKLDHEGRLDETREIPIGLQVSEEPVIKIWDSTSNEKFRILIKVREIV